MLQGMGESFVLIDFSFGCAAAGCFIPIFGKVINRLWRGCHFIHLICSGYSICNRMEQFIKSPGAIATMQMSIEHNISMESHIFNYIYPILLHYVKHGLVLPNHVLLYPKPMLHPAGTMPPMALV